MERTCYRCGGQTEEQAPFCASCGAPQIRVAGRTAAPGSAEPDFLNTPPPPLISAESTRFPPISGDFSPSRPILWKKFAQIVLPTAVLAGVSAAAELPLGLLIFLPASVVLAIHLYRRQQLGPIKSSVGARLGAFTGLVSYAFFFVGFAVKVGFHRVEYREAVTKALQDATARNPDPQVQQIMHSWFGGTTGMLVFTVIGLGLVLVFFLIIASIAGAVAAAVSSDKRAL